LSDAVWSWKLRSTKPPWEPERVAIWDHLNAHIEPDELGLTEGGLDLPDEEPISEEGGLRWAAGAEDGVFGHHMEAAAVDQLVHDEVQAFKTVLRWPSRARLSTLYELLASNRALTAIDPLLERIVEEARDGRLQEKRLRELAIWLARRAPDRDPVKVAIASLGLFHDPELRDLFLTFGRHDEFTLFSAVALANLETNSERSLWELARHVDGWGRIHIVERLAGTNDPQIRQWLLREGYRNSVMLEYTALIAATTGGLLDALRAPEPDEELLVGAGEILSALVAGQGGPAEGIEDYQDGAEAVGTYLEHLEAGRGKDLSHLLAVRPILRFLEEDDADWPRREQMGWSPGLRQEMVRRCKEILARPSWREEVLATLANPAPSTYWQASEAAKIVGIDAWPQHLRLIEGGSLNLTAWHGAAGTEDPARMRKLVEVAERVLDLEELASGPATSLGFGPLHQLFAAHEQMVGQLARFPGQGWPLVEAGLRSPVIRIRHAAIRTLEAWGRGEWPPETTDLLDQATAQEPDDEVRKALERLR